MNTKHTKSYLLNFNIENDLDNLQNTLDNIWNSNKQKIFIKELFIIFENNPEEDGNGVFWSILHGLEGIKNYEIELCKSIERKPVYFNILMAKRVLNPKSVSFFKEKVLKTLNNNLIIKNTKTH